MKNLSRITVFSILILICISWLLNCKGGGDVNAISPDSHPILQKVAYSSWISPSRWTSSRLFDLPTRTFEYQNTQLNFQKMEESELYVYTRLEDGRVHTLPFTEEQNNVRFDYTMSGGSTLHIVAISMNGLPQTPDKYQFRYVVIPKELTSKIKIDMLSYSNVKDIFSLPE